MALNFTQKQPTNKRYIKQITAWVEDTLPEHMEDVMVMVNEMACYEPGCAPLETVVSLLGEKSIVFKIFKPSADVVPADVIDGVQNVLAGNEVAQHIKQQPPQQPAAVDFLSDSPCQEVDDT